MFSKVSLLRACACIMYFQHSIVAGAQARLLNAILMCCTCDAANLHSASEPALSPLACRDKIDLENHLEAEQEYIMNKLQTQVDKLATEKGGLHKEKSDLQRQVKQPPVYSGGKPNVDGGLSSLQPGCGGDTLRYITIKGDALRFGQACH